MYIYKKNKFNCEGNCKKCQKDCDFYGLCEICKNADKDTRNNKICKKCEFNIIR